MTPYEAVHGQQFPLMVTYLPDTSKVHATYSLPHNCDVILCTLKENSIMAQKHMKQQEEEIVQSVHL